MVKGKAVLLGATVLFLAVECVLGVLVHTVPASLVSNFRYAVLLLAFFFSFLFYERSVAFFSAQLALLCTVAADYILILHPEHGFHLALIFFLVAQLAWGCRLFVGTPHRRRRLHLPVRHLLAVAVPLIGLLFLGGRADTLALLALCYLSCLLANLVLSFGAGESRWLFVAGFSLFLLCDLFVGFGMLGAYAPIGDGWLITLLTAPPIDMEWVFYTPSQALLSLSLLPRALARK